MSGGRWDYKQRNLSLLAEDLCEEKDLVLQAAGKLLAEIAGELEKADRSLCNDAGPWDDTVLLSLVGGSAVLSISIAKAKSAKSELERLVDRIDRLASSSVRVNR